MKKILLCAVMMLMSVIAANAKEFTKEQLAIRLDIVKFLSKEGFEPKIASEGDIKFTKNDVIYIVIINEDWSDPYLVTLYAQYGYDDDVTRKMIENCVSAVGEAKTVKLYPGRTSYSYRSDVFCKDASAFTENFYSIFNQINEARATFKELYSDGLADIDMSNSDSIFIKAKSFYFRNEDAKAFRLFKMLANQDYAPVYRYLASAYRYGYGTDIDYEEMEKYYKKAIETGDMRSAYYLGDYYYDKKDYNAAFTYFMRCASNDGSYRADGLYMVGKMQENGQGTEQSLSQAKASYRKSLQFTTVKASNARKALMRLGEKPETVADFNTEARTSGMTPAEMFERGDEYEYGKNKRFVSLPKAFAYYQAAADNGYTDAYAKMGSIYIDPYFPFDDKAKSDKWYQKAEKVYKKVENNDGKACYLLGIMYENGYGVSKDERTAADYFQKGAKLGNSDASYKYGMVMKKDAEYKDAFNYFEEAARKGQAAAMYELAYLYEVGYGTLQDRERAVKWYQNCYKKYSDNWEDAKNALKRLGALSNRE